MVALFSNKKREEPSKEKPEAVNSSEEEILQKILLQKDKLSTLLNITSKLPNGLVLWFNNIINKSMQQKSHIEIEIAPNIQTILMPYLPGDIIIKRFTDLSIGDVVECIGKFRDNYMTLLLKVVKINTMENTVVFEQPIEKNRIVLRINNILYILDKVIPYDSSEWKNLVHILGIHYDIYDILRALKSNIDQISKIEKFYDKKKALNKLNARLKLIQNKISTGEE